MVTHVRRLGIKRMSYDIQFCDLIVPVTAIEQNTVVLSDYRSGLVVMNISSERL